MNLKTEYPNKYPQTFSPFQPLASGVWCQQKRPFSDGGFTAPELQQKWYGSPKLIKIKIKSKYTKKLKKSSTRSF